MPAPAMRAIVTANSMPALRAHVRLHFDPVRKAWAVLSPERVLWPDEIGRDVREFLQLWSDRLLVRL